MNLILPVVYMLAGTVILLCLVRHINGGPSILDAVLSLAIGWAVGVPFGLIAMFAWLISAPGMDWLTRKRW